jgi:hypothetical protein
LGPRSGTPSPLGVLALRLLDDEGEAAQKVLKREKKHHFPRSLGVVRPFMVPKNIARHSPAGRFICWRSTRGEHYRMCVASPMKLPSDTSVAFHHYRSLVANELGKPWADA